MYIKVRAKTGAKKESVHVLSEDTLAIAVKEKSKRNMANERIIDLVALHFKVPAKTVCIIKGHHSPSKMISINIKNRDKFNLSLER